MKYVIIGVHNVPTYSAMLSEETLCIGTRSSQASDGDVFPNSQWNGVLGIREIHSQRPRC